MVKIRMMRMGSKKSPFYRVIAIDERGVDSSECRLLQFLHDGYEAAQKVTRTLIFRIEHRSKLRVGVGE